MSEETKEPLIRRLYASRWESAAKEDDLDSVWSRIVPEMFPEIMRAIQKGVIPPLSSIEFEYEMELRDVRVKMHFKHLGENTIIKEWDL